MRRAESPEVLRIGDLSPSSVESCFRELDDVFLQTQARIWLGEVLHARFDEKIAIGDLLADGELLFQVSKAIWEKLWAEYGDIKYSKSYIYERNASGKSGGRYMPYSNVDAFLKICQILGLTGIDLFSASDVVEKRDIRRVCMCIRSLSKKARLKHLNVPDFDVVTYTIAMPTDMVGGLRRSLERAQYSLSSSTSSKEVCRRKIQGTDHIRHCDFSSEESEEGESNFRLLEFQSPISVTSYDSATLSSLTAEDSPGGNSVVEGTLERGENLFLLDDLDFTKVGKVDYILASNTPCGDCHPMNSRLIYSPQSCLKCQISLNGSTYCTHWKRVDATSSPENHAEVCEHDFDYWETSGSSIGDLSTETNKFFLADCKEKYGDKSCNSPVPWDGSATSPTVRLDYMQQGFSRLSVNTDSVDEIGLGVFAASQNHSSDNTLLNGKYQFNTSEDLIENDFYLSKFQNKEEHLNCEVSGIKDTDNTAKENTHMKYELPSADLEENPQNKKARKGCSISGGTDVVDITSSACKREPLPLVDGRGMECDKTYADDYSDQCGEVLMGLTGSFVGDFSTIQCKGEKGSMILNVNNIPGTSSGNVPSQAIYPIHLHENFVAPKHSNTNSLLDVSTEAEESHMELNVGTKFSSMKSFCSSQLNSQSDHCQLFLASPSVACSGVDRKHEICRINCSHKDEVKVDFSMEYSGQLLIQADCTIDYSCKDSVKEDCSIHCSGQNKVKEDCHVDSSGEDMIQEDCSIVCQDQNKIHEVCTVDYSGGGTIQEDFAVDCSVQDKIGEDCNGAVPVAEDTKVLFEAKMEIPVYFNEDCSDVLGKNDRDPGTARMDGMENCFTPELVPFSLGSDRPFLTLSLENFNNAKETIGEIRDCCQILVDDKHLQVPEARSHENVHSTGNMDEGRPDINVIDREGGKNKENKKQFLKSLAGGLTLFGAVFFIFHIRRGGKVKMGESVVPLHEKRQSQEGIRKSKAATVYPGERLKFQERS
ncbi:uncharacterized protein [Aristolochia californica]|uniref:uncharacterized protein isoform X2 n=1 Tax=Aristolochia californica TaxID=171875 RepID=UPI0035D71285